jgi:hypothetical protein
MLRMSQERDTIMHLRTLLDHHDHIAAENNVVDKVLKTELRLGSRQKTISTHAFIQLHRGQSHMHQFSQNLVTYLFRNLQISFTEEEIRHAAVCSILVLLNHTNFSPLHRLLLIIPYTYPTGLF